MKYSLFTVILPELSPEKIVQELKKSGFDGVEWRIHKDYHFSPSTVGKEAKHIEKITEDAGLVISNLGTYVSVMDQDLAGSVINAAAVMNAPSVRLVVPVYNQEDGYQTLFKRTRENLEKFIPLLKDTGIKILLEIHHTMIIPSASSAYAMLKDFPPEYFGVIYDPGNMVIEGREQWKMGLEILGPYLSYVHAKNVRWFRENKLWKWEWASLEEGAVDWEEVFVAMKMAGYDGFISIENLFHVPLKTQGLVNEDLGKKGEVRPWTDRISSDIAYLKSVEKQVIGR